MASGMGSIQLGDREGIQTASPRKRGYLRAIQKISRCGLGGSGGYDRSRRQSGRKKEGRLNSGRGGEIGRRQGGVETEQPIIRRRLDAIADH